MTMGHLPEEAMATLHLEDFAQGEPGLEFTASGTDFCWWNDFSVHCEVVSF